MTDTQDPAANGEATAATADTGNVVMYPIPGAKDPNGNPVQMQIDCGSIPPNVRLDFLKAKARDYVQNSVNQATVRHNKALAPWAAYDAANAADPTQTAVPAPTGERPTVDLIAVATAARDRLYAGQVRKMGEPGKPRETVDPLTKLVNQAVTRELFDREHAKDSKYKWTDAVKAIGSDGIKYLNGKIEELVAAGGDRAALEKFRDERYIKPAQMMLGQTTNKSTKDVTILG
jgi:hypothetical protein